VYETRTPRAVSGRERPGVRRPSKTWWTISSPSRGPSYLNRLVDAGIADVTDDERPRRYAIQEIGLTVTMADDREYTTRPALSDDGGA
jgi:hypothetical protein